MDISEPTVEKRFPFPLEEEKFPDSIFYSGSRDQDSTSRDPGRTGKGESNLKVLILEHCI